MKIGMNIPLMVPGIDRDKMLAWCRGIDAGPWSSLALGERINFPNHAAIPTLAMAAALTERVRLMPYVLIMPMHSEVNRAKELATIDVISEGRLCLGVGAGARDEDYKAVGAAFHSKRLSQLEQQVATMKRVWAGEIVVDGPLRPVEPAPFRSGGPEILAASLSQAAIKHVSRWADGLAGFSFGPSIEEIQNTFDLARRYWQEHERPEPRLVTSFWYALGPAARTQLDTYLHRYLNFFGEQAAKQLAKNVTCDSAEKLRDMIHRIEDTGADEVSLVPTTSDPADLDRVAEALGLS
ncbi:MAG: LLM class flavin-dependent oxidoreductase [bacterium]|nr:LLM class flavin-dependent oxidoreductase [bacterium]